MCFKLVDVADAEGVRTLALQGLANAAGRLQDHPPSIGQVGKGVDGALLAFSRHPLGLLAQQDFTTHEEGCDDSFDRRQHNQGGFQGCDRHLRL
jgi:hypothetical protein